MLDFVYRGCTTCNALAALAAAAPGYGVPLSAAITALGRFEGVRRRQDLLFEARGVRVYDDSPTTRRPSTRRCAPCDRATPRARSGRCFEARSATACRALHQEHYARWPFRAADRVILAPLGRSDIPEAERLDLNRLTRALGEAGTRARAPPP